ncbi:MAG TPA: hypothetical protein VFH99_00980 [Candidatus Saccharimonadales bacterium]|nr:hypothetical protein [Candidatus Saccharimonadales bacterium]
MKLKSRLFYGYILSLVLYSAIVLIPKPSPTILMQYHITAGRLRVIDITIILVLAAIWFAGFYGYGKFRDYAKTIRNTKDGKHIKQLSTGLLLLVLWLPVSSIISSALNYIALRHPAWLHATTIINHYVSVILPLAAYVFISLGARGLSRLARQRPSFWATNIISILLIYTGIVYIRLVASTHHRGLLYQMSIWPIFLTLVAPYIYMWSIGAMAAYELFLYSRKSPGFIYRKSWRLLAFGFGWLIITSIAFQYLTSLTARLQHLSLYTLLVIVYALLALLSIGFVLIAFGTRKLQKIEEV